MGSASSSQSKAAAGSGAHGTAASSAREGARRARTPAAIPASTVVEEEVPGDCADCDICKHMMGGACRDEYVRSRRCSTEAELAGKDPVKVERCLRAGAALVKCVFAHEAYYRPYIQALEKKYEEEQEARRFDHLAGGAEDV